MQSKVHHFQSSVQGIALPVQFTYPFHYTPHPLCVKAAEELQAYLAMQQDWQEELSRGKMFGVLVVRAADGSLGYLAAFSGNLAHSNLHLWFVPPVYDLLQPDGFFKVEEQKITAINHRIQRLETEDCYVQAREELTEMQEQAACELTALKAEFQRCKSLRGLRRNESLTAVEIKALVRESQFQKAELKRQEKMWKERLDVQKEKVMEVERTIASLKQERKSRSAVLQRQLFEQFQMLNGYGERKGLPEIFAPTPQGTPPAGAGECCAPKLLQYAFLNGLSPVCMAEFWWGASPKKEVRHHGFYYPACQGKCGPILGWMLQGLDVEPNPLEAGLQHSDSELNVVYEDDWLLVVNKPAGMLSVPGKGEAASVYSRVHARLSEAEGPLLVHRLDMATSGLLLVAKNKGVHKSLQVLFEKREIKKRYLAWLDGEVVADEGRISLPLCLDPLDRPRQMVSREYGKESVTIYKVMERKDGRTKVAFYPQTGRTHQLRVHAAHAEGLNAPIVGDPLYGKADKRLFLQAESLWFVHPVTGESMYISCPAEF